MGFSRQDERKVEVEPLLDTGEYEGTQILGLRRLSKNGLLTLLVRHITRMFTLHRAIAVLKPSFMSSTSGTTPQRPRPTAWLDGLRGCASFVVFIYHFQYQYHKVYDIGYGGNGGVDDYWILQLPVFRVFYYGVPQVSIFWVLSGVALSLRPLQLARAQDWEKLFGSLSSSIFRRMLRLYLPCVAVSFCILMAKRLGFYNYADRRRKEAPFYHMSERSPPMVPSFGAHVESWAGELWLWGNPLSSKHAHRYNTHFCTIPIEFNNSIYLFATLAAYSKLKSRMRVACVVAMYLYTLTQGQPDVSLFFAGMVCAEYILVLAEDEKRLPFQEAKAEPSLVIRITQRIPKWVWLLSFYASLHMLSSPDKGFPNAFGYNMLSKITPRSFRPAIFWRTNGAVLLIFTLSGGKFLQVIFANRYTIYLGKISFPLYLLHGPLNQILGFRLVPFFWNFTGAETLLGYEAGLILGWCTEAVALIWTADFVERVIDQPSVSFGRWLQNQWSV